MTKSHALFKAPTPKAFLKVGLGMVFFSSILLLITTLTAGAVDRQKVAHETYIEVGATITKSKVLTDKMNTRDQGRRAPSYSLDIEYEYQVGSQLYKSNRYAYYTSHPSDKTALQSIIKNYPLGAKVTAYHSPEDPKEVVLDNSVPDTEAMRTTFHFFFIAGLVFILLSYQLTRKSYRV